MIYDIWYVCICICICMRSVAMYCPVPNNPVRMTAANKSLLAHAMCFLHMSVEPMVLQPSPQPLGRPSSQDTPGQDRRLRLNPQQAHIPKGVAITSESTPSPTSVAVEVT